MQPPPSLHDKLPSILTMAQAATLMEVEEAQVVQWARAGRLRAFEQEGEEARFRRDDVLRLVAELQDAEEGTPLPFPVVGIGASAGGVEAASEFIGALPPDLGMAYVLVAHLSPTYESHLHEILARKTPMPVRQVEDGLRIEADHVYVIPPNTNLSIVDGVLELKERCRRPDGGYHPITDFLVELAENQRAQAVGVILSGVGTDGALGLKAIRSYGGWTFAQDETAKFADMPRNAQEAGAVDFVLSPAEIARQLAELEKNPVAALREAQAPPEDEARSLNEILELMYKRRGVDFTLYKRSTVNRRILRRMMLHRISDAATYSKQLLSDAEEVDLLFEDLLINVTTFFRDSRFFEALAQRILPRMLANRAGHDPLRIWVAGCSTGEESVSIAIALTECFGDAWPNFPVQIFSTDVDPKAVEFARHGIYPKIATEKLSPEQLKRFFIATDHGYQVVKPIREMCVFAQHDLLKDPPFSRIDLVSCQNVLIYFDNAAQQRVLNVFHYALNPDGLLALGRSETTKAAGELFVHAEREYKLYAPRGTRQLHLSTMSRLKVPSAQRAAVPKSTPSSFEQELDRESERMLLHRHVPASIVVNRDLETVRFRGNTAPFMSPHTGRASLSLLKLVREDLAFELRALLHQVKNERMPLVRSGIEYLEDGVSRTISIEVTPLRTSHEEEHYLIVFLGAPRNGSEPSDSGANGDDDSVLEPSARRIALLERVIRDMREQMRILAEEAEHSAEELQTSSEEVISNNEELQSLNEELQTSREELQSTNEELTTINDELLQSHDQLREARDLSEAILATLDTPLVILDSNMRVCKANTGFYRAFRTRPEEMEGTLVHDLGNQQWKMDSLRKELAGVLANGATMRDFEVSHTFPEIGDRTLLLNAKRIDGLGGASQRILVTMDDVTERRRSEEAVAGLAAIVTSSDDAILSFDIEHRVVSWNDGATRLFGYEAEEVLGKQLERFVTDDLVAEERDLLARARAGERIRHRETECVRKDGSLVHVSLSLSPLKDREGTIIGVSKIARDITQRIEMEASLRASEARFHLLADNMEQLAWMAKPDGSTIWFNKRWEEFTGIPADQVARRLRELHHPDYFEKVTKEIQGALDRRQPWECIFPLQDRHGAYHWFLSRGTPYRDEHGVVQQWFGTNTDITDRVRAEEALRDADRRKDEFLATLAHELRNPLAPLRSGLEVLKRVDAGSVVAETRSVMERQINQMVRLVDDLLDLGRISSGRLVLQRKILDVRAPLEDAVESIRPMMESHGQKLDVQLDLAPMTVRGDASRLMQVVSNLLHNAYKFSPNGATIELRCGKRGSEVEIVVQDYGIGIPVEFQRHVFDMFTQFEPEERARAGGGLGIGLHIVKRVVAMHGGEIFVKSGGKGRGTIFTIRLPFVPAGEAPVPEAPEPATPSGTHRILVVDDNADSALMLSMVLESMGCETRMATSGEQALEVGEEFEPTLVLTDIGMPGMDGYEICRRMRKRPWGSKAAIVAVTGWGQPDDRRRSRDAGFDEHVVKPVEGDALLKILQRASV